MKIIVSLFSILLLAGCATKGVDYYWGNYSNTLYALKKAPSPETRKAHIEQLEKIIATSAEKEYRVPPGIQAELGYLYAKDGQTDRAGDLFQSEMASYPESRVFVQKLQTLVAE